MFSGLNMQIIIKIVNFWESYLKNEKVEIFWDTVYIDGQIDRSGENYWE